MVNLRPILRASAVITNQRLPNPNLLSELPGPPQYPIIGTLPTYWSGKYDRFRYQKVLFSLFQEYGPIVKENFGDRTIVHVFDPEDIKNVSKKSVQIVKPPRKPSPTYFGSALCNFEIHIYDK